MARHLQAVELFIIIAHHYKKLILDGLLGYHHAATSTSIVAFHTSINLIYEYIPMYHLSPTTPVILSVKEPVVID